MIEFEIDTQVDIKVRELDLRYFEYTHKPTLLEYITLGPRAYILHPIRITNNMKTHR